MSLEQIHKKVTGAPIYGADLRLSNLNWTAKSSVLAVLLRFQKAGYTFLNIDHNAVPADFSPSKIVTAPEIAAAKISLDGGWLGKPLFVTPGNVGEYIGQPVAIAYFDHWLKCRRFKNWLLKTGSSLIKYSDTPTSFPLPEQDVRAIMSPLLSAETRESGKKYGSTHYVRLEGSANGADEFSAF
jgi:hypothetical protein